MNNLNGKATTLRVDINYFLFILSYNIQLTFNVYYPFSDLNHHSVVFSSPFSIGSATNFMVV